MAVSDFQKLNAEIDKLDASIQRLEKNAVSLKEKLESGHWGTQQVKEFQAQLDAVNARIEAQRTKRLELIDERQIAPAIQAIQTLQEKLDTLRSRRTVSDRNSKEFIELENAIKNADRALASFQSRAFTYANKPTSRSGDRFVDYEARLADVTKRAGPVPIEERLQGGMSLFLPSEVQALREKARQAALKLQEYIASIEKEAYVAAENIRGTQPVAGTAGYTETPESRFTRLVGGRLTRPIPSTVEEAQQEIARELKKQRDAQRRTTKADERAAAEAERLANIRGRVGSDPRYAHALLLARERGLKLENLTKIEDRGGGIESLLFQSREGGVQKDFRTYVNTLTGKATAGVTGQYRSFTQGIVRDIGELAKWSLALAAIYGPLNKLKELIGSMIENETKLADAVIAVNTPLLDQGQIFDIASQAAKASGESVTGVIDAFTQAYRAAGRYEDQTQRQAQASKLLADALTLSKISSLDQAQAIDTLTAALLQNDKELGDGAELLNKWVRVSQVAYVGIDTLAVGVAVLGDAAETVGLDIDHLNALIAVLAETSISGSKEAANTAKALVGAYQSAEAEKELNRFGIALRRTNGEVRDFLDIYTQLSELRRQGILAEADISEIALALGGGGVRRAKDASALINNITRLENVAEQSRAITGDSTLAQDALATKLDTVQTALTQVENAFQSLAQTLGNEGGILDLIQLLAKAFGTVVETADALFSVLGKSGPALATFAAAALALGIQGPIGRESILTGLSTRAGLKAGARFEPSIVPGSGGFGAISQAAAAQKAADRTRNFYGGIFQPGARAASLYAGLSIGIPALQNLAQGNTQRAQYETAGGVIGAAIGQIIGGPVGLAAGAAIGTAIGDAFLSATEVKAEDFSRLFAGVIDDTKRKAGGETGAEQEALLREVYQSIGGGNVLVGQIGAAFTQLASKFAPEYKRGELLGNLAEVPTGGFATREAAAFAALQKENPALYNLLQEQNPERIVKEEASPEEKARIQNRIKGLREQANIERQIQLQRAAEGEITPTEYKKISENLSGYATAAYQDIEAFGAAFIDLNKDIDSTSDAYKAYLYLTTYGSQEQIDYISSIRSDMDKLINLYENWDALLKGTEGREINIAGQDIQYGGPGGRTKDQLLKDIEDLRQQGAQLLSSGFQQAQLQQLRIPAIVGDVDQPRTRRELNQDIRRAKQIQDEFYQGFLKIPDDMYYALKKSWDEFAVIVKDAGGTFYEEVTQIQERFLAQAEKERTGGGAFRIQTVDLPSSQKGALQAQIDYFNKYLKRNFPQYQLNDEEFGVIFEDHVTDILHGDNLAIKLALEKLIDVNQKQLDGIYNLPEGATGFLPYELFQAISPAGTETGGGGGTKLTGGLVFSEQEKLKAEENQLQEQKNRYLDLLENKRGFTPYDLFQKAGVEGDLGYAPREGGIIKGYRGDLGYAPRKEGPYGYGTPALDIQGLIQSIKDFLGIGGATTEEAPTGPYGYGTPAVDTQAILQSLKSLIDSLGIGGTKVGAGVGVGLGGGAFSPEMQVPEVSNKLDITIDSNVQLMVDGRVLADIVKTYLASELLQAQQTQSTITRRYVI